MKEIPKLVKKHISNAEYYFDAANQFPSPTRDAVKVLLLLVSRENIRIAKQELNAWAQKNRVDRKLYKDHIYKLDGLPSCNSIGRIILGEPGTQAKTINYKSGQDLAKLYQICRYGSKGDSENLSSIFLTGWHIDDFESYLCREIRWTKESIEAYKKLLNCG